MSQFRLRKKFRKDDGGDADEVTSSGIHGAEDAEANPFRPKTFVNHPRDQVAGVTTESTRIEFDHKSQETLIVKVHGKPKLPVVGATLGKCKLNKQIGKGSSCLVFIALHQGLQIDVAVKVFLPDEKAGTSSAKRFREQFKAEAQTLAKLDNPNIVRVLDFEDAALPYMILEYVDGLSLMARLKKIGVFDPEAAARIIIAVCFGLETAHKGGVIHRDIKPENILIRKDNVVKLADLGIAKLTSNLHGAEQQTQRGILCGTPAYVAPEQALNANAANEQSDVYSLGATFYHIVTGRYPFDANTIEEMISKHITQPVVPPRDIRPLVHPEMSSLIVGMMHKDSRQRPSVTTVRRTMEDYLMGGKGDAPTGDDTSQDDGTGTISMLRQTFAKKFRRKDS